MYSNPPLQSLVSKPMSINRRNMPPSYLNVRDRNVAMAVPGSINDFSNISSYNDKNRSNFSIIPKFEKKPSSNSMLLKKCNISIIHEGCDALHKPEIPDEIQISRTRMPNFNKLSHEQSSSIYNRNSAASALSKDERN